MDIVTTSNFHATLLKGKLSVVFIPAAHIRRCSWPLLNLLLYGGCWLDENEECCVNSSRDHICRSVQTEIFSIVYDPEGATLFMDPNGIDMFAQSGMRELIHVAPQRWHAIQIHLGPMVAEFPGVVSFLSKLLAEDRISILNMSTYDTDIIYVQEQDLAKAISCFQRKLSRGLHGLKEAKEAEVERKSAEDETEHASPVADSSSSSLQVVPPPPPPPPPALVDPSQQYLLVYAESLALVRLQKEMIRPSAFGLTQLVLLSHCDDMNVEVHGTSVTKKLVVDGIKFWSYTETAEEISLMVDEQSLASFDQDAVIVSPERWRAIKLGGRSFGFDETGVVAAMSGFDTENQVLNVSSFGSNLTLVLEHTLNDSLATLCENLHITEVRQL